LLVVQDDQLNDQSHIIGAETSVYDFACEDDGYLTTTAHGASNQVATGARWVEGYSAPSSSKTAPCDSGLKLRVSNKQIVGLVMIASLYLHDMTEL